MNEYILAEQHSNGQTEFDNAETMDLPELEELEIDDLNSEINYDVIHSNLISNEISKSKYQQHSSRLNAQLNANYYYNNDTEVVDDTDYGDVYEYKFIYNKKTFNPPLNFSVVEDGIYRSGHPIPINFEFLSDLKLKTIIYLGDKEDQFEYYSWIKKQKIEFYYIKTESSSEPFVMNNPNSIISALQLILDKRNFPILVHSNKGKHRIGLLIGVMRKMLQGWCLSGIFDEYVKFAGGKGEADLEFMELFNPELKLDVKYKPDFVRLS